MAKSLKPFWFLLAILCALILIAALSKISSPEIVPWRTDFTGARREADSAHKPLLVYFTASWCEPCQRMKHTTWADKNVESALRAYIPVQIDIDTHHALALQYGAEIIPAFVILDDQERAVKSEVGALGPEEFIAWLNGSPH